MNFHQALKENNIKMLTEATLPQLVSKWKNLTPALLRNLVVFDYLDAYDRPSSKPMTGSEVKKALMAKGIKEQDPMLDKVVSAADAGYNSYTQAPEKEYRSELEKQRRNIMGTIKGAAKRTTQPSYYARA